MTDETANAGADEALEPEVRILGQYVKDLSFENPNAPAILQDPGGDPAIKVNVNVDASKLDEDVYEVVLTLDVDAKVDGEKALFITELSYAGVFGLIGIDEEHHGIACLVEAPRLIFPFARRIVADVTRDGGFPPLMLEPIDFMALFQQRMAQEAEEAGEPN